MKKQSCIAYGDCNTEGLKGVEVPVWAELVAGELGMNFTNCGHTMSTTRELQEYIRTYPPEHYKLAFIQYGLVDSWLTFRGAPYVLYYPDNPRRKLARKLVKKLKKWARPLGLQERLGSVEQVPLPEYTATIRRVVQQAPDTQFVLVATAPNLDEPRNPRIGRYNSALESIGGTESNALYVSNYDEIWEHRGVALMEDGTHFTETGHRMMAECVLAAVRERSGWGTPQL